MFYRLRDRIQRRIFAKKVHALLDTPPVRLAAGDHATVLSQLQHKDLLMYLAAIKSFTGCVPVSGVYVIDDGTLTAADVRILEEHIPGIHILPLFAYRDPRLPRGGTWERLIAIARLSEDRYVVQLDADTLSLGPLDEVVQAFSARRSFTIGTWDRQTLEPASKCAERAKTLLKGSDTHVQIQAEACLDKITHSNGLRYVRGCSGFAGFAPSVGKLDRMYAWSDEIRYYLGDVWNRWGSEQVMSNLLVANMPDSFVLPHPDYSDCLKMQVGRTRFVHFIGTCRFSHGKYTEMIRNLDWYPR